MSAFETFKNKLGPPADCRMPARDTASKYGPSLPADLLRHWTETGWCSYGEGLLWTIEPDSLRDVAEDWVESPIPFLRSGFGDFFYWSDGEAHFVDIHRGIVKTITDDLEILFDYTLTDDEVLDKMLRRPLYREALARLGKPLADECYAFVPALALGGPGTADSLQRVKLREQLGILAQLHGA